MKADVPDELFEAIRRFVERLAWFSVGRDAEEGLETDKVRMLLAEWDEGLAPWLDRDVDEQIRAAFEQWKPMIATARAKVHLMFLVAIHKLLEIRVMWLLWEMAMKAPGRMKQSLAAVSPDERERLLALTRETLGKEFDPAEMFQEAMVNADAWEAAWPKMFNLFKKDWPDECTPELEARIHDIAAPAIAVWIKELRGEIIAITTQYPSLRA